MRIEKNVVHRTSYIVHRSTNDERRILLWITDFGMDIEIEKKNITKGFGGEDETCIYRSEGPA